MGKFSDIHYAEKRRPYLLSYKLKALYSYRIDFFFISLLLILSIFYFRHILEDDTLLLFGQVGHGDLRYALTVHEHFNYHLENIPVHAAKLPLLSILYPLQIALGDLLAEKVFTILTLFLAATLVYLANKQFVRRFEGKRGYFLSASCFVGSLVFMYNPWTINKIHHHYWLVLSLAASFLLIAVIDSYLHSKQRNNVNRFILMAFSTSLVATQLQSAIIYLLPMLIIHLAVNLIFHRSTVLSKYAAKKIATLVIIITACNLFWLVPVIQLLTADNMSQGVGSLNFETSEGFVTYGIVQENVEQLSRRATIHNVLEGTGSWLWGGDGSQDASIKINNIDLWQGLAFLPLIFILLFFIIRAPIRKDIIYIVIFFSALAILSVILATGSYYNDIYTKFFLDFPLGESIRDPYKFSGLYFVAISFFASASIYRIDKRSLKKNIVIILLMIGLIFSWGWIGLTGDLNGHLTESAPPYPHDLSDVTEYLRMEYGISNDAKNKIFWYPAGGERSQLQHSSLPELSTESLPHLKLSPFQLNYINDLIKKNNTSFIPLLEYLGVQYVVIREDFIDNDDSTESDNDDSTESESLQEIQMRLQNLKALLHKNIVFESGRFGVYKLNATSLASVSHAISAGTDDLSTIGRVIEESEHLNNIELGPFLEDSLIISDGLPPEPPGGAITIVDPTSQHYLPRNYWSAGSINGGWLNTIRPHLNNFGINTWQFDYNKGFIFTWGEKYIPSNYNLENAKTLATFHFNSVDEASQWQNNDPKNQLFGIQNNAMIVVLNSSDFGWKTITSPAFDVSTDGAYVIDLRMRYYNAEGVHLKVTEYDKNDIPLKDVIVQNIGGRTSDWKDITFSYRPSSKEVTSIKLSIWHGHLTKQPLPNVLLIDSARIYDVSDQLVENSINVPFKVGGNNNDHYKVFIRYLESPQGGLINATLEGSTLMQISSLSPYSKFAWEDLGEYTLNPGSHTMTFTNGRGFNAINAILLIQKDQFEAIKGRIEDWVNQNSTTILRTFEAESDMNMNDTTLVDDIPSGIDDNIVLVNSTAWRQFDVKKEGDYRIWIEGSGTFTVTIDDQKEIVNAAMNRPTLSDSFRLKEGESRLEVTPSEALEKLKIPDYQRNNLAGSASNTKVNDNTNVIDSIWLVSDSNDNRLYQLLDEDNNDSLNQTQVTTTTTTSNNLWSSQKYEIKLSNITTTTTKPLMISLAEPFNPDLKAAIYMKDGVLSKIENLIPLFYSLKSGIYIDSLATDAKVVIYDARVPIGWLFVISSFVSLASYVLLTLSTNVKLTNGFKGFAFNLNRLMKEKILPK
jgi:hypothetical protein